MSEIAEIIKDKIVRHIMLEILGKPVPPDLDIDAQIEWAIAQLTADNMPSGFVTPFSPLKDPRRSDMMHLLDEAALWASELPVDDALEQLEAEADRDFPTVDAGGPTHYMIAKRVMLADAYVEAFGKMRNRRTGAHKFLDNALTHYQAAEMALSEELMPIDLEGLKPFLAEIKVKIASILALQRPQNRLLRDDIIDELESALALFREANDYYVGTSYQEAHRRIYAPDIYETAGFLHKVLWVQAKNELRALDTTQGALDLRKEQLAEVRRIAAEIFPAMHGSAPVDKRGAVLLEQGALGSAFSIDLGTQNVFSCLALTLHPTIGGPVSLAHMDNMNDPASLQLAFDTRPGATRFDSRWLGARCANPFATEVAHDNVRRTLRYIIQHPNMTVNIISASIFKEEQRTGFIVNTQSHTLRDAVPSPSRDAQLMVAMRELTVVAPRHTNYYGSYPPNVPLKNVYSDQEGYAPLLLRPDEIDALKEIHNLGYFGPYEAILDNHPGDDSRALVVMENIAALYEVWNSAVNQLIGYLDARIDELRAAGYLVSDAQRGEAISVLRTRPVFVGSRAEEMNAGYEEAVRSGVVYPYVDAGDKKVVILRDNTGGWPEESNAVERILIALAPLGKTLPSAPDTPTSSDSTTALAARFNPGLREALSDIGHAINITQPEDLYRTHTKSQKPPTRGDGGRGR